MSLLSICSFLLLVTKWSQSAVIGTAIPVTYSYGTFDQHPENTNDKVIVKSSNSPLLYYSSVPLPKSFAQASENVEKKILVQDKILQRPLAFSYTNRKHSRPTQNSDNKFDKYEVREPDRENKKKPIPDDKHYPKDEETDDHYDVRSANVDVDYSDQHITDEDPVPVQYHNNPEPENSRDNNHGSSNIHPTTSETTSENLQDRNADNVHGSSNQHQHSEHKGPTEYKAGGGKEHHTEHDSHHGEKGHKKYDEKHEHEKASHGKHDEEGNEGEYSDHGGQKKKHHHDDGYSGGKKYGDKGEKGAKYEESGKHDKGHSTEGEHNIHKKEEYEKKQEFFDEYHEGGEQEKHGGFHDEDKHHKGGFEKGGHLKAAHHDSHYKKKGAHDKGKKYKVKKGHKLANGHKAHHEHNEKYGKKNEESGGKKWKYAKKDRK